MRSSLQFPSALSSSLSLERFKPGQLNPRLASSIETSNALLASLNFPSPPRKSQDLPLDTFQNNGISICIPDSKFDCRSEDEGDDDFENLVYSKSDRIKGGELGLAKHNDIHHKLENNESGSVSTQDEQIQSRHTSCCPKGRIQNKIIRKLRATTSKKQKESEKMKRNSRRKRVAEAVFNFEMQKVLLKVECCTNDSKEARIEYLTRDELLEEDPLLLLYFYESHLKFKRMPRFQANNLKTV